MTKTTRGSKPARDILDEIADKIVASLELAVAHGAEKFELPWSNVSDRPRNFSTGRAYTGMNAFNLLLAQLVRGFDTGYWLPIGYCKKNNISFKGARSEIILIPVVIEKNREDGTIEKKVFFKNTPVFNIAELSGVDLPKEVAPFIDETEELTGIDDFVASTGAQVYTDGKSAFYDLKRDTITMPKRELFNATKHSTATQNYYTTLLHELVHWTGAHDREGRFAANMRSREEYAQEELVAEIGASLLSLNFGLASELKEENRSYIASWMKSLENDTRHIHDAAKKAVSATRFLERISKSSVAKVAEPVAA